MSGVVTVNTLLQASVAAYPDHTCLIDEHGAIGYADLEAQVARLADGLAGLGLAPASRVLVFLEKSITSVAVLYACMRTGLIGVPVNPRLKPAQVHHILADSGALLVVATPHRLRELGELPPGCTALPAPALDDLAPGAGQQGQAQVDTDPALILYTSGSSGMPKGVVVSHRNLVVGCTSVNAYLGTGQDDVILALLPMSFDAGLSQITTGFAAGATVVLHTPLLPHKIPALVRACGVTAITAVPPLWSLLLSAPWEGEGARVRLIANTGGHMSAPLLARLRERFPQARPFLMYGLTEAFRSSYLDPAELERRPGSIGKAIPNAELLVLRPDGTRCGADETGELVHRGPLVTLGYWNAPEKTAERFRVLPRQLCSGLVPEVAVWSGDLVRCDGEGYLYYVGRRDEMLKTAGYRVSPTEIETVLHGAPGVREAVVFGLPDGDAGDEIIALVVAGELEGFTLAAVEGHLRQALPPYMVPHLRRVGELPRLGSGKIDRGQLREQLVRERAAP